MASWPWKVLRGQGYQYDAPVGPYILAGIVRAPDADRAAAKALHLTAGLGDIPVLVEWAGIGPVPEGLPTSPFYVD